MRLRIEQSDSVENPEIYIKCGIIDENLQHIIDEIKLRMFCVNGVKDGAVYNLALDEICYFESMDNKTLAYCEKEVFQCSYKLYELEEKTSKLSFMRISKYVIANITKIQCVKPQLNGGLEAVFCNGERQRVERSYVKELRNKLKALYILA